MRELIVYERARADRTGQSLSVVICCAGGEGATRRDLSKAIDPLSRTIRHTDHLGWFDQDCLGVILPLTNKVGAERFVETLANADNNGSGDLTRELTFRIFSYPDSWIEDAGADAEDATQLPASRSSVSSRTVVQFVRPIPRWKRALDIFGSLVGLVVLGPLLALVALYIKIVSPGPVIFRQTRVGRARREFTFFKFRTMHHNNNEGVHSHHAKDFIYFDKPMTKLDGIDPRIIKGGRILRKLAIDELPQLFNILRGDMSLVGPRPCIPYEADEYLQWHHDRFSILPGLTGLWQVSGKNKLTFQQMIRLDIEYSRRMSLLFDLWLVVRTIPTVIQLGIEGTTRRLKLRGAAASARQIETSQVLEPSYLVNESEPTPAVK